MSAEFTLIAHRGFSSQAPENTFAAFDLALASAFDNFELDTHLTADGTPVVIHDAALERTTDGRGPVAEATLEEVRRLDAGSWFGGDRRYAGERVPTLEEVLARYAGRAHIHLELKSSEPELPARVAELLDQSGWLGVTAAPPFAAPGITVTSFSYDQLRRSKAALPRNVRHGWLVERIDRPTLEAAAALAISGIYPRARYTTPESVRAALEQGCVPSSGVNSSPWFRALLAS